MEKKDIINLDKVDRKIILFLFRNGRANFNEISKECGISKEVAKYRYESLIKKGLIKRVFPIIDYFKLGYNIYRLHIKLEPRAVEDIDKIINEIKNLKVLKLVDKIYGKWDILIHIYSKTLEEFVKIYNEILLKYGDYIDETLFTIITNIHYFTPNYILENSKREEFDIKNTKNKIEISDIEKDMIKELIKDGRKNFIDISMKLNYSLNNISYHFKELTKKGVFKNFIPIINQELIGYQKFNLKISLYKPNKKNILLKELKTSINIIQIIESIGKYDLEIECHYKDINELLKLIDEINKIAKIKDYEIVFDNDEIVSIFDNEL